MQVTAWAHSITGVEVRYSSNWSLLFLLINLSLCCDIIICHRHRIHHSLHSLPYTSNFHSPHAICATSNAWIVIFVFLCSCAWLWGFLSWSCTRKCHNATTLNFIQFFSFYRYWLIYNLQRFHIIGFIVNDSFSSDWVFTSFSGFRMLLVII